MQKGGAHPSANARLAKEPAGRFTLSMCGNLEGGANPIRSFRRLRSSVEQGVTGLR